MDDKVGIQGIVSKLNPEIVKTVIQSASLGPNKSLRMENHISCSPFTLDTPTFWPSYGEKNNAETEEMTIVFNGKVFDFDLPTHKVQNILKLAYEEQVSKSDQSSESRLLEILLEQDLLETLDRGWCHHMTAPTVKPSVSAFVYIHSIHPCLRRKNGIFNTSNTIIERTSNKDGFLLPSILMIMVCGAMGAPSRKPVDVPFSRNYVLTWAFDHIKYFNGGFEI
ncbi:Xyloglucan endotransglucosylase/hydrolase 5 [Forsythia ovata]|uniref:Xyloglucan endotransglucosylase/hydrolase 5 n=1 Tax=Forsythia ovata TaxID=205694 RepID=A0ABD1XDF8_9LAMI